MESVLVFLVQVVVAICGTITVLVCLSMAKRAFRTSDAKWNTNRTLIKRCAVANESSVGSSLHVHPGVHSGFEIKDGKVRLRYSVKE